MTIANHNNKFGSSEVMRNLEKVAIKRGMIQPEQTVKTASKKESYECSDDLRLDMLKLAKGLRERGYEKEADSIEDKVFNHKFAEERLYDVSGESGDDLIDFAHPDGDVPVGEGELGLVETILSIQKKIHDKINKKPTGKYAQLSPAGEMAKSFGQYMSSVAGESAEHLSGEVKATLEKVVGQDLAGKPLSYLYKVASFFDSIMKKDVRMYTSDIAAARQGTKDMAEVLNSIAENVFAKARGKAENPLAEGTYGSVNEVAKILGVVKEAQDNKQIAHYLTLVEDSVYGWTKELMNAILAKVDSSGKESGKINWQGNDFRLAWKPLGFGNSSSIFESGKCCDENAILPFSQFLKNNLRSQIDFNRNPQSVVEALLIKLPSLVASAASVNDSDEPSINVYPILQSLFVNQKWMNDDKRIEQISKPQKVEATVGDGFASKWLPRLNTMISFLGNYLATHSNDNAKTAFKQFVQARNSLRAKKAGRSFDDIATAMSEIFGTRAFDAIDMSEFDGLMSEQWRRFEALAGTVKESSKKDELKVKAQGLAPAPAAPAAPKQQTTKMPTKTNVVLQIQQALQDVAKALQEKKIDVGSAVLSSLTNVGWNGSPTDLRGVPGSRTNAALAAAEKLRTERNIESAKINAVTYNENTLKALQELSNALRSGTAGFTPATRPLGTYNVDGQNVQVHMNDVSSLRGFQSFLEREGLGNYITVSASDKAKVKTAQASVGMTAYQAWTALNNLRTSAADAYRSLLEQLRTPEGRQDKNILQSAKDAREVIHQLDVRKQDVVDLVSRQGIDAYTYQSQILDLSGRSTQLGEDAPSKQQRWGYGTPAGEATQEGGGIPAMAMPIGSDINFFHPLWQEVLASHSSTITDVLQEEGVINFSQWRNTPASTLASNYAPSYFEGQPDSLSTFVGLVQSLLVMMTEVRRMYAQQVGGNPDAARLIKNVAKYSQLWSQMLQGKLRMVLQLKQKMGPRK